MKKKVLMGFLFAALIFVVLGCGRKQQGQGEVDETKRPQTQTSKSAPSSGYEVHEGIIKDTFMRAGGILAVYLEGRDVAFTMDMQSAKKHGLIISRGDATGFTVITTGSDRRVRLKCKKGSNWIESLEFLPDEKK